MTSRLATVALVGVAMAAFAANSILARQALFGGEGAWLFGLIRIVSGAVCLGIIHTVRRAGIAALWSSGSWSGAVSLTTYIALFSIAYLSLPAGIGALILFAAVQFTMLTAARLRGEDWGAAQYTGFLIAVAGAVLIFAPGVSAVGQTPLLPAISMLGAGIAWGLYSLPSRNNTAPALERTTGSFIRGAGLLLAISLPLILTNRLSPLDTNAVALAIASGALASGLGYAVWYAVLPRIRLTQASIAQLSVPALAALGGLLFLNEPITTGLVLAMALTLGGVALGTLKPKA